jgi:hypothetical protein
MCDVCKLSAHFRFKAHSLNYKKYNIFLQLPSHVSFSDGKFNFVPESDNEVSIQELSVANVGIKDGADVSDVGTAASHATNRFTRSLQTQFPTANTPRAPFAKP